MPDRHTPDPDILRTNGWTTRPIGHRAGHTIQRWFGPAPHTSQPPVGLNLATAWTVHCVAVDYGFATPAEDTTP